MKKFIILILFSACMTDIMRAQLVYPTRDASVNLSNPNADLIWFGYTPVKFQGNVFHIYYKDTEKRYAISSTGDNWTFISNVNAPSHEAIVQLGNTWHMGYHTWINNVCHFHTAISYDGLNFQPDPPTPLFPSGEDMFFMYNTDVNEFYGYIRPQTYPIRRRIGLMRSTNFVNWSSIQTVLAVDSMENLNPNSPDYRKQFYSMSVARNGNDWWGVVNVYRLGDLGQDTEQNPPYTPEEHTVEPHLVYSRDGINWTRTNNRQAFIPRYPSIMQSHGICTIIGNELWVYAVESERRHTDYENINHNNRWFALWRYRIQLSDLEAWKPVTTLNLTLSVEGYFNPSSNTHNIKDTLSVYLRNNYFPYAIKDSAKSAIDSLTLQGNFRFSNISSGTYYIAVKGKNCIETWSKSGGEYIAENEINYYDFTTSSAQAFGNNLKLKGNKYCLYSGDVYQDGITDGGDLLMVDNAIYQLLSGHKAEDLNGDRYIDAADLSILDNNVYSMIQKIVP